MSKKNIGYIIITTFIVIGLTACDKNSSSYSADYPDYADIDSLIKNADIIIDGTVVEEKGAKKININLNNNTGEDLYVTYTVVDVEVVNVMKGDLKAGDIIEIKQLGDADGTTEEKVKEVGYFKKNQECVFFLESYKNMSSDMPYSVLNPWQGSITFEDGKSKVYKDNELFDNDISKQIIIEDLKEKIKKQEEK